MRYLISALLLIAATTVGLGTEYSYRDGYYWSGNQAYTRSLVQTQGYWQGGCYYPGSSYYTYAAYTAPATALPAYNDPNFEVKLLEIAANRDKYESELRKNAFQHQYRVELIKALGFENNFRINGYGMFPPYVVSQGTPYASGTYNGQSTILQPANATTQYGYSYSSVANLYNPNDLNSVFQQSAQLTLNSQKLAGDANAGFQAALGQEGANRAKIAEILARGQVAMQIINSMQAPSTIETKGFSFKIEPGGKVEKIEKDVSPDLKAQIQQQWAANATKNCAQCHAGKSPKGGFDVNSYPGLTNDQKQVVYNRISSIDDKIRMPPPPASHMTTDELRVWFLN